MMARPTRAAPAHPRTLLGAARVLLQAAREDDAQQLQAQAARALWETCVASARAGAAHPPTPPGSAPRRT